MNIVRYLICLITFVSFFLIISFNRISDAVNLEENEKALKVISDFADRICDEIPLQGESGSIKLSGDAKAELSGLFKKLANLGIEGAGTYQKSDYQGVLQEDLVEILNDSRDCKLKIFKELKSIILDIECPTSPKTYNEETVKIMEHRAEEVLMKLGKEFSEVFSLSREYENASDTFQKSDSSLLIEVADKIEQLMGHFTKLHENLIDALKKNQTTLVLELYKRIQNLLYNEHRDIFLKTGVTEMDLGKEYAKSWEINYPISLEGLLGMWYELPDTYYTENKVKGDK